MEVVNLLVDESEPDGKFVENSVEDEPDVVNGLDVEVVVSELDVDVVVSVLDVDVVVVELDDVVEKVGDKDGLDVGLPVGAGDG